MGTKRGRRGTSKAGRRAAWAAALAATAQGAGATGLSVYPSHGDTTQTLTFQAAPVPPITREVLVIRQAPPPPPPALALAPPQESDPGGDPGGADGSGDGGGQGGQGGHCD